MSWHPQILSYRNVVLQLSTSDSAIAMAEPSKQNKAVRQPGTRKFKVASSLGKAG